MSPATPHYVMVVTSIWGKAVAELCVLSAWCSQTLSAGEAKMHWDPCFPRSSKDWPSSHCQHKWEWNSGSALPQTYQWDQSRSQEKHLCRHQHHLILFLNLPIILSPLQRGGDYQSAASKPWVKELTPSRGRSRATWPLCEDRGVKSAESSALLSLLSRTIIPPEVCGLMG